MAVNQPADERHAPHSDAFDLLVKIAALVAVVLPIVGAGVRATAFALAGVSSPLEMAVAQPVSDLVSTALKAVVPIAGFLFVLAPTVYREWPRPNVAARYQRRLPTSWALVVGITFLAGAGLLLPWPGGLIGLLGAGGASYMLGFLSARQQLTFYRLASVVFLAAIASALGAGINGVAVGEQVNSYRFASSAALTDGNYAFVGESAGFVYLESCQRKGIVGVSQQVIVEFSAVKTPNVWPSDSLYEIIFKGTSPKIGYRRGC